MWSVKLILNLQTTINLRTLINEKIYSPCAYPYGLASCGFGGQCANGTASTTIKKEGTTAEGLLYRIGDILKQPKKIAL